jgi:hypothetical protein
MPENRGVSYERITNFCNCYARALADVINTKEFEALTPVLAGESKNVPASFLGKIRASETICRGGPAEPG